MSVLELTRPLSVHSLLCLFIQFDTHFIPLTAYLLLVTPPPQKKKKKKNTQKKKNNPSQSVDWCAALASDTLKLNG